MNKLVYNLAEQADVLDYFKKTNKLANKFIPCALLHPGVKINYDTEKLEKFAQLIVKECSKIREMSQEFSIPDEAYKNLIKKEFEIEY